MIVDSLLDCFGKTLIYFARPLQYKNIDTNCSFNYFGTVPQ